MIVVHDAAGVRRQAGMHAERINALFNELLSGHLWDQNELREVLGRKGNEQDIVPLCRRRAGMSGSAS